MQARHKLEGFYLLKNIGHKFVNSGKYNKYFCQYKSCCYLNRNALFRNKSA